MDTKWTQIYITKNFKVTLSLIRGYLLSLYPPCLLTDLNCQEILEFVFTSPFKHSVIKIDRNIFLFSFLVFQLYPEDCKKY